MSDDEDNVVMEARRMIAKMKKDPGYMQRIHDGAKQLDPSMPDVGSDAWSLIRARVEGHEFIRQTRLGYEYPGVG